MRCCPVCYSKVRPTVYGTATTGTSLEIKYKIQCRNCGFGCDKAGSVIVQYDEETMNPIADDHGLRKLIRDWDSILRDPDRERLADMKYIFWFECTDNGGGHQAFEVKAENKQEAIKKGMAFAKKHASGDICGDWECKMISEWTT